MNNIIIKSTIFIFPGWRYVILNILAVLDSLPGSFLGDLVGVLLLVFGLSVGCQIDLQLLH